MCPFSNCHQRPLRYQVSYTTACCSTPPNVIPSTPSSPHQNGVDLGVAFSSVQDTHLFPVIGLNTCGEEVTVNFGASAFVGPSISTLLAAQRKRLITRIQDFPLPTQPRSTPGSGSKNLDLLPSLVMQHLIHHRYSQTAKLLSADLTNTSSRGGGGGSGMLAKQEKQQPQQQAQELLTEETEDVQMASLSPAEADTEMTEGGCSNGSAGTSRAGGNGESKGLSDLVGRIAGIAVRQQVRMCIGHLLVKRTLYSGSGWLQVMHPRSRHGILLGQVLWCPY